MSTWLH